MLDIKFYMKVAELKKKMMKERQDLTTVQLFNELESFRSPYPVVYNIETTNLCNMNCYMCPGPTQMTRPRVEMSVKLFKDIAKQIRPFSSTEIIEWEHFVKKYYNIKSDDMSENHFFTYIIPKVLVLHGYGEPLIDRTIVEKVKICDEFQIPSYFSCNPWNICGEEQARDLMEAGLDYIKFSTDSADDFSIKQIRGKQANFKGAFKKIQSLIKIRDDEGYPTQVIITMLDLNRENNQEDFEKLKKKFEGMNVYIYLKSQDQLWFEETGAITKSIHWREPCQFPWSSMTVKSNGECVQCVEDFNNEIVLGDAQKQTLTEIWNSKKYDRLRMEHTLHTSNSNIKCRKECDMKLMGDCING